MDILVSHFCRFVDRTLYLMAFGVDYVNVMEVVANYSRAGIPLEVCHLLSCALRFRPQVYLVFFITCYFLDDVDRY